MDFELSQDHKVLQAAVRDFVEKEIKPIAVKSTKSIDSRRAGQKDG